MLCASGNEAEGQTGADESGGHGFRRAVTAGHGYPGTTGGPNAVRYFLGVADFFKVIVSTSPRAEASCGIRSAYASRLSDCG